MDNDLRCCLHRLCPICSHVQRLSSADGPAFGRQPVPAALVCAGGVNAADHAQTFPTLADVLRKQVRCCAAVSRHASD